MNDLSKTQVDRLGERLRRGDATEEDFQLLELYKRSFASPLDGVVGAVRNELGLNPTGRRAKSTTSIAQKLRRESIRLTQMQDIAGCRVVTADLLAQETAVQRLAQEFPTHAVIDRRGRPSHGYRAVHLVVTAGGTQVEIQVRTELQHLWAEVSEKWSDVVDPSIKYGGGDAEIRSLLAQMSGQVAAVEAAERNLGGTSPLVGLSTALSVAGAIGAAQEMKTHEDLRSAKVSLAELLELARALAKKRT